MQMFRRVTRLEHAKISKGVADFAHHLFGCSQRPPLTEIRRRDAQSLKEPHVGLRRNIAFDSILNRNSRSIRRLKKRFSIPHTKRRRGNPMRISTLKPWKNITWWT